MVNRSKFKCHLETHELCEIKCSECSQLFPNQKHLETHLQYHKTTNQFCCDICQKKFKWKSVLKNHILKVHQYENYVQQKFTCIFCKIVYDNKEELELHSAQHTLEEKVIS